MSPRRNPFESTVESGLRRAGVDASRPLLLAVSGGADSTALLVACLAISKRTGTPVHAAHFDHRLRPESAGDALAVARTCATLGVPCTLGSGDVRARARRTGTSIETAARDARYDFLARAARATGAQGVATGHTQDDQAETVLMHIVRGAGTRGLGGMRPSSVRSGRPGVPALAVFRPMLQLRHKDAVDYCPANSIEPLVDPSNADLRHSRNLVRHKVMPLLAGLNPRAVEALARLADISADDLAALDAAAVALFGATPVAGVVQLDRAALLAAHPALARYSLRRAYELAAGTPGELNSRHIEAMLRALQAGAGRKTPLPDGLRFTVTHRTAVIAAASAEGVPCPYPPDFAAQTLPCPGVVKLAGGFTLAVRKAGLGDELQSGPWAARVAADAVSGPLIVRARKPGDRFHPFGMPGPMKLQDFFVNEHIPNEWRDHVPVIEAGRGILWVAGTRVAEWAKVPRGAVKSWVIELRPPTGRKQPWPAFNGPGHGAPAASRRTSASAGPSRPPTRSPRS